jgi:hypothetical protein
MTYRICVQVVREDDAVERQQYLHEDDGRMAEFDEIGDAIGAMHIVTNALLGGCRCSDCQEGECGAITDLPAVDLVDGRDSAEVIKELREGED